MNSPGKVWVFGDYRNYFQNRVTLQLIAKGRELSEKTGTSLAVALIGNDTAQYAMEYAAHGADELLVADDPKLTEYSVETYAAVMAHWVRSFRPEILLAGATSFGREFFPRLAKRLKTGLSADCVGLDIDDQTGLLVQITPAWGGELQAEIVTTTSRPQMATVHPGIFKEKEHSKDRTARILYPELPELPESEVRVLRSRASSMPGSDLDNTRVVLAGGRGVGSAENFDLLHEIARLIEAGVGATRPVVVEGWAGEERLLGQTGRSVKPKLVICLGTSGALQFATGIQGAEFILAIDRDPSAPIFKIADLGLVGDVQELIPLLLEELNKRV